MSFSESESLCAVHKTVTDDDASNIYSLSSDFACLWLRFTRFPYHNDPSIRPEQLLSTEEQIVIANPRLVDCAVLGEVVVRPGKKTSLD